LLSDNPLWSKRRWFSVIKFDEKIWLLGGHNYDGTYLPDEENDWCNLNDMYYSLDLKNWNRYEYNRPWMPRHAMFTVNFQDKLLLFSGYNNNLFFSDVWSMKVELDKRQLFLYSTKRN
jgi:hypothetical protein